MDQELDESQQQIRKTERKIISDFPYVSHYDDEPRNSFPQNEHAKLLENYKNVSLQVTYLQEIMKNLENKIQELNNRKEVQKTKLK